MKAVMAVAFGFVIVVGVAGAATGSKHDKTQVNAPACAPVVAAPKHGREAVAALGSNIDEVAAKHGRGPVKLTKQFVNDSSLWVDPCGELFYNEDRDEIPSDPPQSAVTLIFPRSETFALHSKAGSSRVIYLDFNGELVSGTAWNASYTSGQDIAASPFDMDGSPTTFSDDEMAIIQNVWLRVAEDYAPFDVDVTTADPGLAAIDRSSSTDTNYGTRALVTNEGSIYAACGCAGIAYVGVFDTGGSHQYYQPAWVLQRGTGANAKVIGEVVSHEVGHNLGLSHDGTSGSAYYSGQGSWAPIMGTAYNRPISQWSRGEYSGANNAEDDFAVIQGHGLGLRADNVGNSISTATALTSGTTVSSRINNATDTDWFSISGSGQLNVVANVAPTSPNLDLKVGLYNPSGTLVTAADPPAQTISGDAATGLSVNTTFTLPAAGTYYLRVDGTGYGDPASTGYSDYASTGEYDITATVFDPATSPSITTTSLPTALTGQLYTTTLAASGGVPPYTWGLTADSAPLPDALVLKANTGEISGIPTASAGDYAIKVKIVDKQNNSTTKSLTLTLKDPPLTITSAIPLSPASLGQPYSYQLTATGARGGYIWSIASGTLPLGTTLSTDGLISGTPTKATSYSFTVRVTSGVVAATKSLSITVTAPVKVTTTTLAGATVGLSYSASLAASGGTRSYVWEIASGRLPAGLAFNAGKITGIPQARETQTLEFRVTDTAGRTAVSAPLTLTVFQIVVLADPNLPAATKGAAYSLQLSADGGLAPYKWARSSGSFPSGIAISTTGLIYGTPSVTGTYTVKLKIQDYARRYAYWTLTLVVN